MAGASKPSSNGDASPFHTSKQDAEEKMDWDLLRDVLVRLLLSPPAGTFADEPASWSSFSAEKGRARELDFDFDNVEYLIAELQAEGVTILPERDGQLTLDEVDEHPLRSALAGPLEELFGIRKEGVGWFCSCVIDGYLDDLRALAAGDMEDGDDDGRGRRKPAGCELCARPMPLTAHHLYPRSEHTRLLKRTQLTKFELQHTLAYLCRPCHSAVHRMIDAATLARDYYSVERLREHEGVERWVDWAGRQRVVGRGLRTAR